MCFSSCNSDIICYLIVRFLFKNMWNMASIHMALRSFCLALMTLLVFSFVHSFIHSNLGEHLLSPRHWEFKRSRVCFQRVYNLEGEIKLHSDTHEYVIRNEQYAGKHSRNIESSTLWLHTLVSAQALPLRSQPAQGSRAWLWVRHAGLALRSIVDHLSHRQQITYPLLSPFFLYVKRGRYYHY